MMAQYLREIRYNKNLEFRAIHERRRNDRGVEVFREIMKHLEEKNTHTVIKLAVVNRAEKNHKQNDFLTHSQFCTNQNSLRGEKALGKRLGYHPAHFGTRNARTLKRVGPMFFPHTFHRPPYSSDDHVGACQILFSLQKHYTSRYSEIQIVPQVTR